MLRHPLVITLMNALAEELSAQELVVLSYALMMRCGNFPQEMFYGHLSNQEITHLIGNVEDPVPADVGRVPMNDALLMASDGIGARNSARTLQLISRELRNHHRTHLDQEQPVAGWLPPPPLPLPGREPVARDELLNIRVPEPMVDAAHRAMDQIGRIRGAAGDAVQRDDLDLDPVAAGQRVLQDIADAQAAQLRDRFTGQVVPRRR